MNDNDNGNKKKAVLNEDLAKSYAHKRKKPKSDPPKARESDSDESGSAKSSDNSKK